MSSSGSARVCRGRGLVESGCRRSGAVVVLLFGFDSVEIRFDSVESRQKLNVVCGDNEEELRIM